MLPAPSVLAAVNARLPASRLARHPALLETSAVSVVLMKTRRRKIKTPASNKKRVLGRAETDVPAHILLF
jgi:hypothetical protein